MRVALCSLGIVSSVLYMFWWFARQTYEPTESVEEISAQFAVFMHLGLIAAIIVLAVSIVHFTE